jgi:hypothetical protein
VAYEGFNISPAIWSQYFSAAPSAAHCEKYFLQPDALAESAL